MIEKHCIDPNCKRHPCFGVAVSPSRTVWACGAHRKDLPASYLAPKLIVSPAPRLESIPLPRQGALF